jgi:integrase
MTKVTLRKKSISKGRQTLYLDFYPPIPNLETGKPTRREFLKLYLYDKPKSEADKNHNKETFQLADNIRATRQLMIQAQNYGFLGTKSQNSCFIVYYRELMAKRIGSNNGNWQSALYYLEKFSGGTIRMVDINEKWCNDFKEYLLTASSKRSEDKSLSQNSTVSYFNKLKATLKQAYKDGLLTVDLNSRIEPIRPEESQRQFLTLEELQKLAKTECSQPLLKKAALFSALTGLRFSDIEKLKWSEIGQTRNKERQEYFLQFRQKKTKGAEVLPISEQAVQLLGERKDPSEKVFNGLKYSAYQNVHLKQWIMSAGIQKDISFHCFRHTYATLQLSFGTDIYTVSKMLGHRELKTTQVYAKIVDKSKRDAANKIIL